MCAVFGCCMVCVQSFGVCVSNGRAGKVAWVTSYYVYTRHDMGHLRCAMHAWCGVCACMCCLGLSAKSNVCDVQYSVLFSLCLECVVIVGHVWCCVYVYVCVCLCLCVWVHACACVYVCVCTCVVLCVMCSMVTYLFIFFLYYGGSVCEVRYGVCCLQRCLSLTLSPQDHQHTERKGTCRAPF